MPHIVWSRNMAAAAVLAVLAMVSGTAQAQQNSLFGASSPLNGNNGFQAGSVSVGGNAGGGGLSLPGNSLPSNSLPGQAGGNTGFGASGFGATGQGGAGGQQGSFAGMRNTNFVGNSAAGTNQAGMNGQFNNRQGQGQNRNRGAQRQNQNQNQTGSTTNNQQMRTVRPQLHVSIDYPKPTATATVDSLTKRFEKLSSRVGLQDVTVEADGSTVILRGSVDTEDARRVAAAMARLEPGVRKVKNELTIAETAEPAAQ